LTFYEQAGEANLKIGNTAGQPLARTNIAEILVDLGEWEKAEALLVGTLPFWRASRYRYFLALCLSYLGRALLRRGRTDEAIARLEEAKTTFLDVGSDHEVPTVDAWIAECRVCAGDADAALDIVRGMLTKLRSSTSIAKLVPQLERIRGAALARKGDFVGARGAFDASLAAGRERHKHFEVALTLLSLIQLHRLERVEPPAEIVEESRSLLARLRVRVAPPAPFLSH